MRRERERNKKGSTCFSVSPFAVTHPSRCVKFTMRGAVDQYRQCNLVNLVQLKILVQSCNSGAVGKRIPQTMWNDDVIALQVQGFETYMLTVEPG